MAGCYYNWSKYPVKLEYLDLEDVRLNFEYRTRLDIYKRKKILDNRDRDRLTNASSKYLCLS